MELTRMPQDNRREQRADERSSSPRWRKLRRLPPHHLHHPLPPTTQMIGIVGVFRLSPIVELGYTFHPSFWGQGYATESVGAFVRRFWGIASYDPHDDGDDGYGDL
ncbi:hypothetical protein GMDG_02571 [Pseudogymnoascus destructans 20631-21]|uniref:N-acetyltransferase domain-containing protein n=1 Tax=Pseudogymnoascus destructans (strain ATCC MYA-4855 / 20631-21) TaxID=658429 RepID=L8G632_PSED2|nr:hypothetical protein GMDG_02571 [Pseudogymnoascus destructans 20631-21]